MGTAFDYFGIKASHGFINLPSDVLKNRKFLKKIMAENKFKSQNSEWWHYNLESAFKDKIANTKWECN